MALTQIKSSNITDGTVIASDIADDSITNVDIKSDAAIDASKLAPIPASKLASTLNLSGNTVTLPAAAVTAHALPAEIGFANVSSWADSAVETITLSTASVTGKTQVSIYEEFADANKTNADWDITSNDTGFDLIDSAYAQTLTPAAIEGDSIAFTLGGGSWVTADIGKRIVNVSTSETGVAKIVSIASTVATCIITTAFTDTNAIVSGDWELYAGEFDTDGNFALSNATVAGGTSIGSGLKFDSNTITYISSCTIDTDKVLVVYQGASTKGYAVIITNTNGVLTYGTPVQFPGSQNFYYNDVIGLSTTQALAVLRSENTNDTGGAVVINISGTTPSFGSIHNFTNSPHSFVHPSLDKLSSTKAICSWQQGAAPKGCDCVVLSVSGNTVSSGSVVRLSGTGANQGPSDTTCLSSSKFMTTWSQIVSWPNNSITGCIGTVSGTTITKGTEQVIHTADYYPNHKTELLTSSSVVFVTGDGTAIKTRYITVSGTVMTINAETTIFAVIGDNSSGNNQYGLKSLAYISATKTALAYTDDTTDTIKSNRFCILTHSGTTVTAGDPISIGRHDAYLTLAGFATSDATEFAYAYKSDETADGKGEVRLINLAGATTVSSYASAYTSVDIHGHVDVTSLDATTGIIVWRARYAAGYYANAAHYTTNLTTRITTYGTPLVFRSVASDNIKVERLTATKAIAVLSSGTGGTGTQDVWSYVLTASGTTLTAGTGLQLDSSTLTETDVCVLSSTQALIVWDKSNQGKCAVLNINGTTITSGTAVVYETGGGSGIVNDTNCIDMLSSTKAIVYYGDGGNSGYPTACVLDVSGSTVTPGSPQVINSAEQDAGNQMQIAKITSTKAICSYTHGSGGRPYMRILTISGTTITVGAAVEFYTLAGSVTYMHFAVISESQAFLSYRSIVPSGEYQLIDIGSTTPVVGTRNLFSEESMYDSSISTLYGSTTDAIVNFYDARTEYGMTVLLSKLSAPLYVSSQYVTTISGTDSVDTTYYNDWNSNTVTETLGGQSAYYAFSVNSTPSAAEVTGGTFMIVGSGETATRNIASSLNSVHGGTEGVWYTNTNVTYASETWVAAATNEAKAAIEIASVVTANQMNGTAFAAISDANLPAFGTQLSIAMTLYSSDSTLTSTIDGVSFNYDGNLINRNKTKDYVIEMPSTTAIRVTAPSSGGPRNARVYVSS